MAAICAKCKKPLSVTVWDLLPYGIFDQVEIRCLICGIKNRLPRPLTVIAVPIAALTALTLSVATIPNNASTSLRSIVIFIAALSIAYALIVNVILRLYILLTNRPFIVPPRDG